MRAKALWSRAVPIAAGLAVVAWSTSAEAGDVKRLSFGLSTGLKPDMASLGSTITQDGSVDTAESTLANLAYGTDKVLMSDRDNLALWHNSSNTNSSFKMLGEEPTAGGPLLGLDLGANVQYDLDDVKVPLFVRAGVHYTSRMSGGEQRRTLGDIAAVDPNLSALLQANGEDPNDYIGGVMTTQYDAKWIEVPISLGLKVPIDDQHSFAYGSVGVSLFQGGFSVTMDVDEKYANVLATHVNTSDLTVTNYSPGAVNEVVDFKIGGMGLNWGLGAQKGFGKMFAGYFELNSSGMAKTVYSSALSPSARQLLTATSSETLANNDPEWFKRLAFPVVTSGASFHLGLRIYVF